MDWLPGSGIFREHTPAFWLSVIAGVTLGYVAGRMRASGTKYEGSHWILWLSASAGVVLGTTIFLFVSMFSLLANMQKGVAVVGQVTVLSLLAQLVIFVLLVLRRRG